MANANITLQPAREPDVMNDPEFDTNSKGKEKSMEDADTCRICRGESSTEEPLFYPCKCSGSIKFVHQSCLMEWLSHSQKKHCELCKTPFRFTKLYHPNMPNSVPLPIFVRQAAVHTWRTLITWSRFHLVLFVWVAWLPWCMRIVWRALFWVGDGGWINWQKFREQASTAAQEQVDRISAEGGSPASTQLPISKDTLASAVVSHVTNALPNFLSASSPSLNLTDRDPVLIRFVKKLMMGILARTSSQSTSFLTKAPLNTTGMSDINARSSWLSNFSFLKFLTPSPTFNNLVIDTLEGQIITLLVVISFILIFLIREWVVQQQPGVNIGAGPNANPPVGPGGEAPILERIARQRAEQRMQPAHDGQGIAQGEARAELPAFDAREPRIAARQALQQPRANNLNGEQPIEVRPESSTRPTSESNENISRDTEAGNGRRHVYPTAEARRGSSPASQSASPQRPSMPKRSSMAKAAEIRRTLEEQSRASGQSDWPGIKIFLELWNRAEKKPSEVLKIIEQEGRGEELSWIVAAMKKLENTLDVDKNQNIDHLTTELNVNASISATDYGVEDGAGPSISSDTLPAESALSGYDVLGWKNKLLEGDFLSPDMGQAYSENGIEGLKEEASSSSRNGDYSLWPAGTTSDSSVGSSPGLESSRMKVDVAHDRFPVPASPSELSMSPSDRQREGYAFHPEGEDVIELDENAAESAGSSSNAPGSALDPETYEHVAFGGPADEDDVPTQVRLPNDQNELGMNQNLGETIMNWLWGDINLHANPRAANPVQQGGDRERDVADLADEGPFVQVEDRHPIMDDLNNVGDPRAVPIQDPEVLAAAAQAGLDPNGVEAVEDVEDLEGIMELVGMQGPLAALIQNGMFCAILVSMTIFLGIWVPYIAGKLFLVFLAHPISLLFKLPLRWASTGADLIIDLGVFSAGCAFYWVDTIARLLCAPVGWLIPPIGKLSQNRILAETAKDYAESAMERLAKTFAATGNGFSESDIPMFSIIAHESLKAIEHFLSRSLRAVGRSVLALFHSLVAHDLGFESIFRSLTTNTLYSAKVLSGSATAKISQGMVWMSSLFRINLLRVSFNIPQRTAPLDYSMAHWNTKDRIIAIIFGYMFFSILGALYLKISASFRGRNGSGRVEGTFAEVLYQAGGVLKVVLIISIEMIVFPLYCGFLLDMALLPIFGNVTALSRVDFLLDSPNTSLFIHWFVGTCYMFHFALFVSMCRKIMRNGVLCKLCLLDFRTWF